MRKSSQTTELGVAKKMIKITEENLIELIKECVAHFIWKAEKCFKVWSDEDEEEILSIIDREIEL